MNRRELIGAVFLGAGACAGVGAASRRDAGVRFPLPPVLPFMHEASGLTITDVRAVKVRRKNPPPRFDPAPGSWSTGGVEVANPMSIYPKYKPRRELFMADGLGPTWVQITTDKGVTGLGQGGGGAGFVVDGHLKKLLIGEDPFAIDRLWDTMWRSTLYYGRKGLVVHGISAVDNALWDLVGQALGKPVFRLLGEPSKQRIPAYCTGNDIEQHVAFGFKMLKLALPHGPADGREGLQKNVDLVKRARAALGRNGKIMMDCWMALTEDYTVAMCEAFAPHDVHWVEEALPPDDYPGMRRLQQKITSTNLATGEHEYTRWGFELLRDHGAADIWQPDQHWCGGLSELRHIDALAAASGIPVIPHGGSPHFSLVSPNSPWRELFMPAPGGPDEVYRRFEQEHAVTRGPDGIYVRPSDAPGFGHDLVVEET